MLSRIELAKISIYLNFVFTPILFNLTRGTWGTLVTVTVNTQENKQTPQEKLHKQSNTGRKLHKQSKNITQTPEPGKKKYTVRKFDKNTITAVQSSYLSLEKA